MPGPVCGERPAAGTIVHHNGITQLISANTQTITNWTHKINLSISSTTLPFSMNYLFDINREELLDAGEQCYIYGVLSNFYQKWSQANVASYNIQNVLSSYKHRKEILLSYFKIPQLITYSTHLPDRLLTYLAHGCW